MFAVFLNPVTSQTSMCRTKQLSVPPPAKTAYMSQYSLSMYVADLILNHGQIMVDYEQVHVIHSNAKTNGKL